jgi:hypothetical protein
MTIENFKLIISNRKAYKYWKAKKNGKKFKEFDRGAGYYINSDAGYIFVSGNNPIGQIWKSEMVSGKIGIYELIEYENYRDPSDMVKHSWWNMIGYENCKPIHECSFNEFITIYVNKN